MARLDKKSISPKIILLLLLLIFFGGVAALQLPIFKVNQVDVRLANHSCVDMNTIKNKISWQGKNILTDSFSTETILKQYPCLQNIKIDRVFPNKIILTTEERQSVIVLQTQEISSALTLEQVLQVASSSATVSGQLLAVDNRGVIFKNVDQENSQIKLIFLDQKFNLGQTLPESLISAVLKMRDKLKDFQISVNTLWIYSKFLVLNSPPIIILDFNERSSPTDKNIDIQLTALQLILQKAKIDNKELKIIDLRFENPVIKYVDNKK
ncbi:MAG: hypothetical protein Q7R43_02720 [Candidatus Daviesbacteria bacterium]|nr:hypothetical protein [Candidatus Daviesbacteria bacterium]